MECSTEKMIDKLVTHIEKSDLPPYFMPTAFQTLNTPLPLTPAGKVDYRALEKEAAKK